MAKKPSKKSSEKSPESTVLNETGRRNCGDRRLNDIPVAVDRRKANRRRHIDPTTCERDYSELEIEFMRAMDDYKQASGRMFPTCSEILEVILKLGYRKIDEVVLPESSETPSPIVVTDNLFMDSVDQSVN